MGERLRVKIDSMAFKGYGVSRRDGKVIFVPYSVTGDEGWVEIIEDRKNYSVGKLMDLLVPSPWRVPPPCPYFVSCGGCQWQHISYEQQTALKVEILRDLLLRLAGLKTIPSMTAHPCIDSYGYRIRVRLENRRGRLGYYRERSHQLVEIERCLIAHPLVNEIILLLRRQPLLPSDVDEIEINVSPEEGKGVLMLSTLEPTPLSERSLSRLFESQPTLKGLVFSQGGKITLFGDPSLYFVTHLGLRLRTSPGSFFQVNATQNQKLIQKVLEGSDGKNCRRALDLYSGVGNLTLPLATLVNEVWGVEENPVAVKDARYNAQLNGIPTARFIHGKVEDVLKRWKKGKPDVIVLDPPRAGSKAIVNRLAELNPERMVYVSCDPSTFARDLRLLGETGYILSELSLVDMFPQSYHMEVVGLLRRS